MGRRGGGSQPNSQPAPAPAPGSIDLEGFEGGVPLDPPGWRVGGWGEDPRTSKTRLHLEGLVGCDSAEGHQPFLAAACQTPRGMGGGEGGGADKSRAREAKLDALLATLGAVDAKLGALGGRMSPPGSHCDTTVGALRNGLFDSFISSSPYIGPLFNVGPFLHFLPRGFVPGTPRSHNTTTFPAQEYDPSFRL